jgi:hypothetical protein
VSGRPLPQRLRLGPVELDRYLAGQLQGLAYMRRLRAIEDEEERHLRTLAEAWHALAEETDDASFASAWRAAAETWNFRRVNRLIAHHNAYYAVEARVPMNPRTGGYARSWHREPYGAAWILERFPADRAQALEAASGSEPQSPPDVAETPVPEAEL